MADNDDEIARARAARHGTPFLNTEQAAAYLGLGPRKLQYMRAAGEGPPYRRHSRYVRYHVDDLIAWSRSTAPGSMTGAKPGPPAGGNDAGGRPQARANDARADGKGGRDGKA